MDLSKEFWEKVYVKNAPKIKGICRRYVSDTEIAEDLMHDAFVTAINKQHTFKGKGHFDAWLRKIAVNTALTYLRKKDTLEYDDDQISLKINDPDTENKQMNNKRAVIEYADFSSTELLEMIDILPEHHKRVFNLYVLDNYTHVQIGKELKISPGTSKSHLARARKKVQQLLYKKAIEKNKEHNKKKRAGILLLVIPGKSHYIERLFRNKFRNFQIEVADKSCSFFDSIKWNNVNVPAIKPYLSGAVVNAGFISAAGGIIITSLIIINSAKTNEKNIPKQNIPLNTVELTDTITTKKDSVAIKKNHESGVNNAPVVVKRKIVRKKTVVIKDTIKIIDTSYVH